MAQPGETIYIEGGRYFEQLITQRAGTASQQIVFTSINGTAVLDGSRFSWPWDQNKGLVELRHEFNRLQGLEIVNSPTTGVVLGADNIRVEGNKIHEAQWHGISTDTNLQLRNHGNCSPRPTAMIRNAFILNNEVYRTTLRGSDGQAMSIIADGFIVKGNLVYDNKREAIAIWLGSTHGEVTDNTVYGALCCRTDGPAPGGGIYTDGASYIRIHRNLVHSTRFGFFVTSEDQCYTNHDVQYYNNIARDNSEEGIRVWDSTSGSPGAAGTQNFLIANNTLIRNKRSLSVAYSNNSGAIINNLSYTTSVHFSNSSSNSTLDIRNNLFLANPVGVFVDILNHNFQLTANSPARDFGVLLPTFSDDRGTVFTISSDFIGKSRIVNGQPDAGAFEY